MFFKNITNVILILALGVFLFGSGYKLGQLKTPKVPNSTNSFPVTKSGNINNKTANKPVDFSLFWEAWDKVEEKFIDKSKLDPNKMVYGAIKGMVSALEDPYTFFLTPEENKMTKSDLEGKFEGIGAQLGLKNNRVIVVAPLKNSPAEKSGIKAGDVITKVDDQPTKDWTLPQAVSKIRGTKGTKVKLTLERNSKELDVEIVRGEIKVESVELQYETLKGKKISHIKLNQFGDNTHSEWGKVIDQVSEDWRKKVISGIVLDLRDNPGGYLEGSVYVASEFLPKGKLVVKQESSISESTDYFVERDGKLKEVPLVILINKGSASASEILAGSLRDYKRAKLVGEKTFGKGSVQEALNLSGDAGLHITVAKWILPNGDWINGKGIEPEIKVENKLDEKNTLTREKDLQLEKAIELLLK